jgi:hypothetical protein
MLSINPPTPSSSYAGRCVYASGSAYTYPLAYTQVSAYTHPRPRKRRKRQTVMMAMNMPLWRVLAARGKGLEVRGFFFPIVSSPLPRATPHVILLSHLKGLRAAQIIRAARRAVGDRARRDSRVDSRGAGPHGVAPHRTTRPVSRAVALCTVREAIRQRHEPKACLCPNCDCHQLWFRTSLRPIYRLLFALCVLCRPLLWARAGREVRDCDAMACSC